MERLTGLFGIALILGIAFLMSNNRRAINFRTVGIGLGLQFLLALWVLYMPDVHFFTANFFGADDWFGIPSGKSVLTAVGGGITKVIDFSGEGAKFIFGPLVDFGAVNKAFGNPHGFIFFFKIIPTILFVAVLINIGYFFGIIQRVVKLLARGLFWLMKVSGAEALSNISSAFVGQVEAQIMIKPYLKGMTKSELLASMSGSFACISGGVMAAYIGLGVPPEYLLAASIMAAPGALAISKIVWPETEQSETAGAVTLKVEKSHTNLIDAISSGCSEGWKIGINVTAMLIGFLALIALLNYSMSGIGGWFGHPEVTLNWGLGKIFKLFAFAMGVQGDEIELAGSLMGQKLVANEFVAYYSLSQYLPSAGEAVQLINGHPLSPKTIAIVSFALCGFANFGSMGIQVGGISALEPERRTDLTQLVLRALVCGTLASYMSATLAGMLL